MAPEGDSLGYECGFQKPSAIQEGNRSLYQRGAAMGELSGDSVTLVRPLASTRAQTRDSRHSHPRSIVTHCSTKAAALAEQGEPLLQSLRAAMSSPKHGQDCHVFHLYPAELDPGSGAGPHHRAGSADPEGASGSGGLHGGVLACLSWALMSAKTAGWVPLHSGVEVGHIVRDANSHSGRHLNTRRICWLTEKMHSRGFTISALHGPEGEGCHHEGVQVWLQQSTHRYGLIGSELMCSRFLGHLPTKRENNIRRIGRGGCFGRKGVAVNCEEEKCVLRDIKTFCNTTVDEMPFECG